jgi:hypothetical protein
MWLVWSAMEPTRVGARRGDRRHRRASGEPDEPRRHQEVRGAGLPADDQRRGQRCASQRPTPGRSPATSQRTRPGGPPRGWTPTYTTSRDTNGSRAWIERVPRGTSVVAVVSSIPREGASVVSQHEFNSRAGSPGRRHARCAWGATPPRSRAIAGRRRPEHASTWPGSPTAEPWRAPAVIHSTQPAHQPWRLRGTPTRDSRARRLRLACLESAPRSHEHTCHARASSDAVGLGPACGRHAPPPCATRA